MTQRLSQNSNPDNPVKTINPYRLLKQGMGLMGGLSILASGLVWIPANATPNTFIIPDSSSPSVVPPAPVKPVKPVVRQNSAPTPITQAAPTPKVSPRRAINHSVSSSANPQLSAPKVSVPAATTSNNPVANPSKNNYIDTTNYSQGNPERYTAPSSVILSDRATGCSSISQNGKLTNGVCGTVVKKQPTRVAKLRPVSAPIQVASNTKASGKLQSSRDRSPRTSIGSVVNPPASIALAPVPKYNRATTHYYYPQNLPQQSKTSLIFPLPIAANITSGFGWRIHPITGTGRMHAGTDLGAPEGTPVLAAYSGEVATADWMGGYGLTVILRHEKGTQESRYAHLSEIFVKPGEWVEQGTVIGRVGSTGMSTGPHLHFEWRHWTNDGWVAVDAGLHLEYALDNLMRAMEVANANTNTNTNTNIKTTINTDTNTKTQTNTNTNNVSEELRIHWKG